MPELPVKEIRLPELHLPELDREGIVRSFSEIRLPEIELPKVERPRFGRRGRFDRIDLGAIDWSAIDLGPAIAGVAALGRLGSRARPLLRSRWTIVAGVAIAAGLATAALLATPAVRERAGRTVRNVRARVDGSAGSDDRLAIEPDLAGLDVEAESPPEHAAEATVVEAVEEAVTEEPAVVEAEARETAAEI